MGKIKLLSSIATTSIILGGTIAPLTSCKQNDPDDPEPTKSIKLTYNGGKTEDVIYTDKSEPLVFQFETEYNGEVLIKSVNDKIAIVDENNKLVAKNLGATEIYAYLQDDPEVKSNSINVTIQKTEDTLTISDSSVRSKSNIIYNPLGLSTAIISGFKADFTINQKDNITKHTVEPEIDWAESEHQFAGSVAIINPTTDIFGKTTFDIQISTEDELDSRFEYDFCIDFTIDSTEVVKSKPLVLTTIVKEYWIQSSKDKAIFSSDWKKIVLTKFLTNIDISSGTIKFSAKIVGDIFKHNPPKVINITNVKHLAGETNQFDAEIVWDKYATLDTDGSFKIQFLINDIAFEQAISDEYTVNKIKQVVYVDAPDPVCIVDETQPYAIVDLIANFVFTNAEQSHPIVKAQWSQPSGVKKMPEPSATEILDISPTVEYTTFKVKFTWDKRFDDAFSSDFVINMTADDEPILFKEKFSILWHYDIRYDGTNETTLIKGEDNSFARVSKFTVPGKCSVFDIEDVTFSDFTWESAALENPINIKTYFIESEGDTCFGIQLQWNKGFDITQDTYCHVDLVYNGEIIVNDFRFLVKKQNESRYWDVSLESKNASLSIVSNTEDLIEVAVTDIAPNSNLGSFYVKDNGNIIPIKAESPHIVYEDETLKVIPALIEGIDQSTPLTIGIDYYTAADETRVVNIPGTVIEGATSLSLPGKIDLVKDKPIYLNIDYKALSGIIDDERPIYGCVLLVGNFESEDITEWDLCPLDLQKIYFSLNGWCCDVSSISNLPTAVIDAILFKTLMELNAIFKIVPTESFADADVSIVIPN